MGHDVIRNFGWEFIILDIIFCIMWMAFLIKKKYYLQWLFGLFGALVVFLTDYVFWYVIGDSREIISLPTGLNPLTFLMYFSFTYGMVEFSYVAVMFSAKNWRKMMYWTMFLYIGWFFIAFFPKVLPMDDTSVDIVRHMSDTRWTQIGMAVGGYLLLVILKHTWKPFKSLTWKKLGYLVLLGFAVHFAMEITLLSSGIRPPSDIFSVLIFNSLIEFNSGVPILFFGWTLLKDKGISIGGETEELIFETVGAQTIEKKTISLFEKKEV